MKPRTYTSWEVKERYNKRHYERITLRVGIGGRDELRELAGEMSLNAYITSLIIRDAQERGKADISAKIGGGGDK